MSEEMIRSLIRRILREDENMSPQHDDREHFNQLKRAMLSELDTLGRFTIDGLRDDVNRMGSRGVTLGDMRAAVYSIAHSASIMTDILDAVEELGMVAESANAKKVDDAKRS